jgi:hypothetical protein
MGATFFMSVLSYTESVKNCADLIRKCLDDRKKITLVLGNGLHFIPVLERSKALRLITALIKGIVTQAEFDILSALAGTPRNATEKLQSILENPVIDREVSSLSPEDVEAFTWLYYERLRYRTSLPVDPPIAYFAIRYLLEHETVNTLISTNYDLYLDRLLQDTQNRSIRNPCMGQYEWEYNEYYSPTLTQPVGNITFWKIHGDFAFFCWPNCGCLEKLPPNDFLEKPPKQVISSDICWGRHFHDFNEINSGHFNWIRDKLRKHLADTRDETRLILVIGFKGYYDPATGAPNNLAKVLVEADNYSNNVFMLVAPTTFIRGTYSYLWNHLMTKGRAIQPPEDKPSEVSEIVFHIMKRVQPYFADFDLRYNREREHHLALSHFVYGA